MVEEQAGNERMSKRGVSMNKGNSKCPGLCAKHGCLSTDQ